MGTSASLAAWQPRYAEHGVALFPVNILPDGRKKPSVAHWQRAGLAASNEWAKRFADNDAFGFALQRSKVVVLDVDSSDERELEDGLARHGSTPLVIRSGSGNYQAWFRSSGEGRHIRPFPGRPVDILGAGYVVAPPSRGTRGQYEIISGSLDDLDRLPTMRGSLFPGKAAPLDGRRIRSGQRADAVWRFAMQQAGHVDDFDTLLDVVKTFVEQRIDRMTGHPFGEGEIAKAAQSAWTLTLEGRNRFIRPVCETPHDVVDAIAAESPDAIALYLLLKRHNARRQDFAVANAMAASIGWDERRFRAARSKLVDAGLITCTHEGGRGRGDPPLYSWKGYKTVPQYNLHSRLPDLGTPSTGAQ